MSFTPNARYYTALDMVLFLTEDVSYRSQPHNRYVELLLHPQEERIVGIKVLRAKRLHAQFDEPIENPLSFLVFVLAGVIEGVTDEHHQFLTRRGVIEFLKQHHKVSITPEERKRINFSLEPV